MKSTFRYEIDKKRNSGKPWDVFWIWVAVLSLFMTGVLWIVFNV